MLDVVDCVRWCCLGMVWVCYLWLLGLLSCCVVGVRFCCFGLACVLFVLGVSVVRDLVAGGLDVA